MSNYTLKQNSTQPDYRPQRSNPIIWGALLVGAGALMLLRQFGLFEAIAGFIWAMMFAAGGLAFSYMVVSEPERRWWAAIPAGALLGLAGTIMVSEYAPDRMDFLAGAIFLGGLALGFWAIYFIRRDFWWAMIPGGVLLSLSAVAAVDQSRLGGWLDAGSLLFFGMGITFLLVAVTSKDDGTSRWWAYIPAGVLILMGFIIFSQNMAMLPSLNWVWPLVLIVIGGALLLKAFANQRTE